MRIPIFSSSARAVGPYSHAVDTGGLVYFSGQTPVSPETGVLVTGGIAEQTRQCFANLFAVLTAAGLGPEHVQKVTVFLTDMANFQAMNAVYKEHFTEPYPARTTIGVVSLPTETGVYTG